MSAYPFGGHPTFSAYLTWANKTAQCKVQTAYKEADDGSMSFVTRITAPNGKHVIATDYDQEERLTPYTIANFDRRLGLNSPWSYPGDDNAD